MKQDSWTPGLLDPWTTAGICLVSALSIGLGAQQAPPAPAGTGLIAGQVLDVTSGLPVPGVEVNLNRAGAPRPGPDGSTLATGVGPIPVLTDSQGRFAFTQLPEGQYSLGTPPRHENVPVRGAALALAPNQRVTDVVLRVARYGSIAGLVRDDAGDPIVGTNVRAFNRRVSGGLHLLFPRGSAVSDDRGQFRIRGLSAGEYLICACAKDPLQIDTDLLTRMASFTVPIESVASQLDASVPTFAPTFHPGSTRVSGAIPVIVGHSDNVMGIMITMLAVRPVRVSGQLTGGGPAPGTSHKLVLFPEDDDPAAIGISEITPVSVMADGGFSFAGVTPGRYSLEAYPADGKPGLTASASVTVVDRDMTGVVLSLTAGSTVRGHVEFPGVAARPDGEAMTRARVSIVPLQMTVGQMLNIGATGQVGHGAQLSADGTFTIAGVRPGRYVVHAGQFGGPWKTVGAVHGPDGISDEGVVTVPPDGIDQLTVTMSNAPMATLQGTITLEKYESSNDLQVVVFPADRAKWLMPMAIPGYISLTRANSSSAFTFAALRPGDYYVIAVPAENADLSPDQLAHWAKRATMVTVRAGQTTTVSLRR